MTAVFRQQMKRLIGLKFAPDDLTTHWEGLRDLADGDLERAISVAVKECESFPSPVEIREIALRVKPRIGLDEDRSRPLSNVVEFVSPHLSNPLKVTREWTYYCDRCSDTGWESCWCGEVGPKPFWITVTMSCGRDEEHYPHEFARRCVCYDSNPAVLKKRDRNAQQAATRTAKQERG